MLDRRFAAMNTFDPAALAEPPPALVSAMSNDHGDRHVLALAMHVGAPVVVTYNLQHFLPQHCEPHRVEAQHPDVFLEHLTDSSSHTVREVIRGIASRNRRPTDTPQAVVNVFASRHCGSSDPRHVTTIADETHPCRTHRIPHGRPAPPHLGQGNTSVPQPSTGERRSDHHSTRRTR